jgi:transposase
MPNHLIAMFLIRRLIELRLQGHSQRAIARHLSLARKTVDKYVRELESHFPDLSALSDWSEESLSQFLHPRAEPVLLTGAVLHPALYAAFAGYERKLSQVGMTRRLLWQDYVSTYQGKGLPLAYTQFCHHFSLYHQAQQVSMHLEHKAGEKLFVDFAGKRLQLVSQGASREVEVFVAVLPCSGLSYVEAVLSQQLPDFLGALGNALTFFGGVPQAIVPDNLKAAVRKADRYEPDINESLQGFASHYRTVITPARSRKPTDKALVERTIGILYSRLYVPLSRASFDSLAVLNAAIRPLLEIHNQTLLQGRNYSRQQRFADLEQASLLALPSRAFLYKHYQQARVSRNCHVRLAEDKHHYSVPYRYVGQQVKIVCDGHTLEVYAHSERIAFHLRNRLAHGYSTKKEHLPASHQYLMNWSVEYFQQQAQQVGIHTLAVVNYLLEKSTYLGQAYKSCAGVLSLAKKYGSQRLERASERALIFSAVSYKHIQSILSKNLDTLAQEPMASAVSVVHENIRGAPAYQ